MCSDFISSAYLCGMFMGEGEHSKRDQEARLINSRAEIILDVVGVLRCFDYFVKFVLH